MGRMARAVGVAPGLAAMLGVAVLLPTGLHAQSAAGAGTPDLARAERLADAGRIDDARREVERWLDSAGEAAARREMARARFLRARLARDADSAEMEYLWVAIDGGPPWGSAAWLRLAQLHLTAGDPGRARQELERLRAEHPDSPRVPESWLWTGRALEALGDLEAACEAWRRAAREAARAGEAGREPAASAAASLEACSGAGLRYAVQLGAFRSREGAREVVGRATAGGLEPRLERDEGLYKVRVGRFASLESAREMAERARRAGLSAVIVSTGPP